MSTITAIEPQKKKQNRFNIFIDGQFAFGASAITVAEYKLKVGQEITFDLSQKLIRENEFGKLFDKTLRFLSYRPRSEFEIRQFLKRKQKKDELVSDEAVEMVIAKLKAINQINDSEFARWWVESRTRFRPRGKRLLKIELAQKGLDREVIEEILPKGEDELQLALAAIRKKITTYQKLPLPQFRQKVAGFLSRRGFDWETIKSVIDTLGQKA